MSIKTIKSKCIKVIKTRTKLSRNFPIGRCVRYPFSAAIQDAVFFKLWLAPGLFSWYAVRGVRALVEKSD